MAWRRPGASHYLNQCWNIVNLAIWNKLQWNLKRNWYIFIQENAFENVVRKLAAILSPPQCIKYLVSNRVKKIIQFYLSYTPYFLWKAKHEGFCITVYCFTITCFYWPTLDNIYGKSLPKHIMLLPIYEIIYKPVVSDNMICIRTLVFIFRSLVHYGHK